MLALARARVRRAAASSTSRPPTSPARTPGVFREDMLDVGQAFRNTYEQTKCEAEHLVGDAERPRAWRSRGRASSWASPTPAGRPPSTSSTGRCARSRAGCSRPVPARPHGRVDVVPVDYVADGIVHADRAPTRPARSTSSPAQRRRDGRRARPTSRARTSSEPRPPFVETGRLGRQPRPTSTAPSTCRTSTWRSCSTTRARASGSGCARRSLRDYFDHAHGLRRRPLGQARHDARRRPAGPTPPPRRPAPRAARSASAGGAGRAARRPRSATAATTNPAADRRTRACSRR